jgi:hypothetical protein
VTDVPHRAVFELSAQLLIELFKPGRRSYEVVGNPIPADARVYGAEYDSLRDVWRVGLEHESFPPCPELSFPELRIPDVQIRELASV